MHAYSNKCVHMSWKQQEVRLSLNYCGSSSISLCVFSRCSRLRTITSIDSMCTSHNGLAAPTWLVLRTPVTKREGNCDPMRPNIADEIDQNKFAVYCCLNIELLHNFEFHYLVEVCAIFPLKLCQNWKTLVEFTWDDYHSWFWNWSKLLVFLYGANFVES